MKLTARELKTIRKNQKLSQDTFANILGISREMVSKMESGKVPISAKTILKIHTLYGPELGQLVHLRSIVGEQEIRLRKKQRGRTAAVWLGVPMYNEQLTGHLIEDWKQARLGSPAYYLGDRNFMDCDFGAVIHNDQPVQDIHNGDVVLCQYVRDTSFLDFGNLYFIVTTNGMELCRHLHPHKSDDSQLVLKADAQSVPDSPLPKKYIVRLCKIKGILRGL